MVYFLSTSQARYTRQKLEKNKMCYIFVTMVLYQNKNQRVLQYNFIKEDTQKSKNVNGYYYSVRVNHLKL